MLRRQLETAPRDDAKQFRALHRRADAVHRRGGRRSLVVGDFDSCVRYGGSPSVAVRREGAATARADTDTDTSTSSPSRTSQVRLVPIAARLAGVRLTRYLGAAAARVVRYRHRLATDIATVIVGALAFYLGDAS